MKVISYRSQSISTIKYTQGALMVVVLIYLAILNLMAVSSARITAMNVSMTQNFISRERVFQAAQSALTEAENAIRDAFSTSAGLGNFPAIAGECVLQNGFKLCAPASAAGTPVWEVDDNWNNATLASTNVLQSPAATTLCGANQSPCFIIEKIANATGAVVGSTPVASGNTNYHGSVSVPVTAVGGTFRITVYATLQAGEAANQKQFVEVMLQSIYGNG